ncbi:MAG: cell wall hydrolase [Clostridia bacterium]|nr:cell wall hydrolase [Clostridia bacterium]
MKKLLLASAIFLLSAGAAKAAEVPVDIRVNGEYIITDTEPVINSGTAYAPIRAIADSLGADKVEWNNGTAHVSIDDKKVSVSIGSRTAYVNGNPVSMNGSAFLHNDRTLIPVRAMSNIFDANVGWDDEYKNVEINKPSVTVSKQMIDYSFTHDELYWLSRIINAESRGESLAGKIAVGDVILNRVKSSLFPNTIYGVIFDRQYGVQFEPTINGSIYDTPISESVAAAKLSLTYPSTVGQCLYFFNPVTATNSWIANNRPYYTTIGGHVFYL